MPVPRQNADAIFGEALVSIRKILDSDHKTGTPGEKLTRIAWVIGNLPMDLRESVINEAQNRVTLGWASAKKPTDW